MALKPCIECGNQISTSAASCPQCGAPNIAKKKSNKLANTLLACAGVIAFISFMSRNSDDTSKSSASSEGAQTRQYSQSSQNAYAVPAALPTAAAIQLPAAQQTFVEIIDASRRAYKAAANDMAKGSTRPTRARGLCDSMSGTTVNNWIGTISTLSTNSDGDGVLALSIAKDVNFKTWNNSFSDISDNTILDNKSALYRKAVNLRVGQNVRFSGTLFRSQTDCFKESSLSMSGSMTDPEFIFGFSSVDPI